MIALIGSGEYLPPMEPVDRALFTRLPAAPHVVCLPTAAGAEGPERIAYWTNLSLDHFTRLGVTVQSLAILDHQSANNPDLVEPIHQANFVYLSGGRPDYLLTALQDTLAWQAISKVLASGGLLAGCSAGAMVLGESIAGFPRLRPGFNLAPGIVILPHYDEIPAGFSRLFKLLIGKKATLVGIEGNTALVMDHGNNEVIGAGGVTIWSQQGKQRYCPGQRITELT